MKKFLPLIIFLLFASTLSAVEGQESMTITAIPPRLELKALPGATLQETIKIRNESTTETAFLVNTANFIVNNNQGTPIAVTEAVSGRWSLMSWITISPKKILLQPQQTAAINLIISIPSNALPGGHYAMVTYNPDLTGLLGLQGSSSVITQKVGSLIYLNVIGDVTEAVNLKNFTAPKFSHYGPINLMAEIENLGDIHIQPQGTITITNLLGDEVYAQKLEEKNIFPFASRAYTAQFPGKWHLGRYAAKLQAAAGSSQMPIKGFIYFWIIPVKELSYAAGALLIIILLLILLKKRKPKTPIAEPVPQE